METAYSKKDKGDNPAEYKEGRNTAHGAPGHFTENVKNDQAYDKPHKTTALQNKAWALRACATKQN
jgi:hypothetical protein